MSYQIDMRRCFWVDLTRRLERQPNDPRSPPVSPYHCCLQQQQWHGKAVRLIDWVVVLRPTRHKIGHFGDVSPSQSLGFVTHDKSTHSPVKKCTTTQNKHIKTKPRFSWLLRHPGTDRQTQTQQQKIQYVIKTTSYQLVVVIVPDLISGSMWTR